MTDYSVTIKVRNARILRVMREAGIETQAELARRAGIGVNRLNAIIGLRQSPTKKDGTWVKGVEDIAGALGCDPGELFSDAQRGMALPKNSAEVTLAEPQVARIMARDVERDAWTKVEAARLLECLSPRERFVVEETVMGGATHREVAEELGISSCRIAQIQCKAMRKMKHPSRLKPDLAAA